MIIGITGGIGAGKTTTMQLFGELGIKCIDSDPIILSMYRPGTKVFEAITTELGSKVVTNGFVDRNKLRQYKLSARINELTNKELWSAVTSSEEIGKPLIFACARIIEENLQVDRLCVIQCTDKIRITRALNRGVPADILDNIIKNQLTNNEKIAAADDIITNSNDLGALKPQVAVLAATYIQLSACFTRQDQESNPAIT